MNNKLLIIAFFDSIASTRTAVWNFWVKGFVNTRLVKFDSQFPSRFNYLLAPGEQAMVVTISTSDADSVINFLRHRDHQPSRVFIIPDYNSTVEPTALFAETKFSANLNSPEYLANQHKHLSVSRSGPEALRALHKEIDAVAEHYNGTINTLRRTLDAENLAQTIDLSLPGGESKPMEWMLDNQYLIESHIQEIQKINFDSFAEGLILLQNSRTGLSFIRAQALANSLVSDTNALIDKQSIEQFLHKYQQQITLTSDELWAFPLLLRLALLQAISKESGIILANYIERQHARVWADLLHGVQYNNKKYLVTFLHQLSQFESHPGISFSSHLLRLIQNNSEVSLPVQHWIEQWHDNLGQEIQQLYYEQERRTILLGNTISSLRLLSQLNWNDIFESCSPVAHLLTEDPADLYPHSDFETRDYYRHEISSLEQQSSISELDIAKQILELCRNGQSLVERHVGYYLIDRGRVQLEASLDIKFSWYQRILRRIHNHKPALYIAIISLVVILEFIACLLFLSTLLGLYSAIVISIGIVFVLSEPTVQLLNIGASAVLRTSFLPKLFFKKEISDAYLTVVAVPTMLFTPESIGQELQRLEVRYLANPDPALSFGLLTDFSDAPTENVAEDAELLDLAIRGIRELNKKYGKKFFLFHRERVWSPTQGIWMGWERKRGKLIEFNQFITGNPDKYLENLKIGSVETLRKTIFVITLDADTQLPIGTAKRLVETLAHPLNRAELNEGELKRGYAIIQPLVSTALSNATATLFSRIFTDPTGIDPYTNTVADIYQDLSGAASFIGKGIYDVRAFQGLLENKLPLEKILSHDLLESTFARTGLASDIELLDFFPATYATYERRLHRWVRGDWQIAEWLFATIPTSGKRIANPLTFLNKWKIADNLRRSLLAIVSVTLLIGSWQFDVLIAMLVSAVVIISWTFTGLLPIVFGMSFRRSFQDLWSNQSVLVLARGVVNLFFLPHIAWVTVDAIIRSLYRQTISGKRMLEWESAEAADNDTKNVSDRVRTELLVIAVFALVFLIIIFGSFYLRDFYLNFIIGSWLLIWFLAPALSWFLEGTVSKKIRNLTQRLSNDDVNFLRKIARKTWRYFDEHISAEFNWLPPDNAQTKLNVQVFARTSPTNIGLGLTAMLTATDLGYISIFEAVRRLRLTTATLLNLERYRGHWLNWYDLHTLQPLGDKYVSTVDSGNLLASFIVVEQGLYELKSAPIFTEAILQGLLDTIRVMPEDIQKTRNIRDIASICSNSSSSLKEIRASLKQCAAVSLEGHNNYWVDQLGMQIMHWNEVAETYFEWLELLQIIPEDGFSQLDPHAHELRRLALESNPSVESLASGTVPGVRELVLMARSDNYIADSPEINLWLKKFAELFELAQQNAKIQVEHIEEVAAQMRKFSRDISLKFLYDQNRNLFHIGYNVTNKKLDNSYYDLLASEARLASFMAVARQEVPVRHWWSLGRRFGQCNGNPVLMSWSGSMFEYLMPLLFTRGFENSLLDESCRHAVQCQIERGRSKEIPWGISEAAFSALDTQRIYQYRAFGVPGLGLRRGLEQDLVVAPYATALALAVNPAASVKNLYRLESMGMFGDYGFYESIDYTSPSASSNEGVTIFAYMAHHQGMILSAISNTLFKGNMQTRFHSNLQVRAAESLLYEKVPRQFTAEEPSVPGAEVRQTSRKLNSGAEDIINGSTPRINLLSGAAQLLTTGAGGSVLKWGAREINRWRADTTSDMYGTFIFLKDVVTGDVWSSTFQPFHRNQQEYKTEFYPWKTVYHARHQNIQSTVTVFTPPNHSAEVRTVHITNHGHMARNIELTSYLEPVLAEHAADRAHPAFMKLSIATEYDHSHNSLLAYRKPRTNSDQPIWIAHSIFSGLKESKEHSPTFEYESDRGTFIGRGKTLLNPDGLHRPLNQSTGAVIDPIMSMRRRISLMPKSSYTMNVVTVFAKDKQTCLELIKQLQKSDAIGEAQRNSHEHSNLQLRHLNISNDTAQWFQKLASHAVYPTSQLRLIAKQFRQNTLPRSGLWGLGISGDLPIILVQANESFDVNLVTEIIAAHTLWHLRGLKTDLVIVSEESGSYRKSVYEDLLSEARAKSAHVGLHQPGGIFVLRSSAIPVEQYQLLQVFASIILAAGRGSLTRYLISPTYLAPQLTYRIPNLLPHKTEPLIDARLSLYNGYGGFEADGAYVINVPPNHHTPAPWSNVLANPTFGTLVSESGIVYSWHGNSQTNRLTPWSNDPVSDSSGEQLYLRDDSTGQWWHTDGRTQETERRVRHGFGYSEFEQICNDIQTKLTVFVPCDEDGGLPIRVKLLSITNRSSEFSRTLSLFEYAELVLGSNLEETHPHIITRWDAVNQMILAENAIREHYNDRTVIIGSTASVYSYSGDRKEFIGRNRTSHDPIGLQCEKLSKTTGVGFDAAAILHVKFQLEPGQTVQIAFWMGEADSTNEARALADKFRNIEYCHSALATTQEYWRQATSVIRVTTPEPSVNFLLNGWLMYQGLACRLWGRSGFYQSGGAFGFRDQLQDTMALVYTHPQLVRDYLLYAATHQFPEGDVLHWWHPENDSGVRTRITDDRLWLITAVAQYVRITGDTSIISEKVAFINADILTEDQHELYIVPKMGTKKETMLEHCLRAIHQTMRFGKHGLPLIGTGDWNDGLNRVGADAQGESVWLGWFLVQTMEDYADLCEFLQLTNDATKWRHEATLLREIVDKNSRDPKWYVRAYYDNGEPLGSASSLEAQIDSLPQSWAVIARSPDRQFTEQAMREVLARLVTEDPPLVKLFTPPFDKSDHDPGYIKGYLPGVRENGGQYTHGSLWVPLALSRLGWADEAVRVLQLMNPVAITSDQASADRYRVEPYVVVADVYSNPDQLGRGGWSWYTGAAGWTYRIWLEEILGFQLRGNLLRITPSLPSDWPGCEISYKYGQAQYNIIIIPGADFYKTTLDGVVQIDNTIQLNPNQDVHEVTIHCLAAKNKDTV